jgi:subtilisin family serine protease
MARFVSAVVFLSLMTVAAASAGELRHQKQPVPGQYIVVLKDDGLAASAAGVTAESIADTHAAVYGVRRKHVYGHALHGYSAQMTRAQAEQVAQDPGVAYVEEDGYVHASATQSGATWGIDRIDQRDLPLSGSYTYNFDGAGVHAYVIDTGIRATHSQFAGRVGNGFTAVSDGNGTNDCAGHGTHVAGTIGGSTYGVAKRVTLHAVRVLGCDGSGTNSGVIAGVDWVRANHVKPAVANMSLGGGASSALDTAVNNAINAGVTFGVAAGNENADACGGSPSRVPAAITVGSSTSGDARSSFSNWGTCVDLFAPGSGITSSWNTSDTATNTISGTSMATPHLVGVAALYLSEHGQTAPATVAAALRASASMNKLSGIGTGSPNRLLYSQSSATPTPTASPTRTATPTATATTRPTPTATPTSAPDVVEVTPGASGVTASSSDTNVPANAVDNNLGTRWSASGDGEWLRLDLGALRTVSLVKVAVFSGNTRRNRFDLQLSSDGAAWTTVFSGESSGTTTLEENHDFVERPARYVRYVGHGNSDPTKVGWNSVSEISVFAPSGTTPTPTSTPTARATPTAATPTPTPTPTPSPTLPPSYVEVTPSGAAATASTNDGDVPANALDNDLATRWSGSGDGAWLKLDLGAARTVGYVKIAWFNGNTRASLFDIQVSNDNATWTTALGGGRSGGTSTAEETFDFPDATARWIRYLGHGNTDPTKSQWNSVTELSVFATP